MGARNFGRELFGLFLLFLALFLLLALASFDEHDPSLNQVVSSSVKPKNMAGMFGAYVSGFLNDIFGILAFLWPIVFAFLGITHVSPRLGINWSRWCGWFLLVICLFILASACDFSIGHLARGGQVGDTIYAACSLYLSPFGTAVVWFFLFLCSLQLIFGISWLVMLDRLVGQINKWRLAKQESGQQKSGKIPASEKAASVSGAGEKSSGLISRPTAGQTVSAAGKNDNPNADHASSGQTDNAQDGQTMLAPTLPNLEDMLTRLRNFLGKIRNLAEILTQPVPISEQKMPDLNIETGFDPSNQQPGIVTRATGAEQPRVESLNQPSNQQADKQTHQQQIVTNTRTAPDLAQQTLASPGLQPSQPQIQAYQSNATQAKPIGQSWQAGPAQSFGPYSGLAPDLSALSDQKAYPDWMEQPKANLNDPEPFEGIRIIQPQESEPKEQAKATNQAMPVALDLPLDITGQVQQPTTRQDESVGPASGLATDHFSGQISTPLQVQANMQVQMPNLATSMMKAPVIGLPKEFQENQDFQSPVGAMPFWQDSAEDNQNLDLNSAQAINQNLKESQDEGQNQIPQTDPHQNPQLEWQQKQLAEQDLSQDLQETTAKQLVSNQADIVSTSTNNFPEQAQAVAEAMPQVNGQTWTIPPIQMETNDQNCAQLVEMASDKVANNQGLVLEWPDPLAGAENDLADSDLTNEEAQQGWQENQAASSGHHIAEQPSKKPEYAPVPLPSTDLLMPPVVVEDVSDDELQARGEMLMQKLGDFGVTGELVRITPGPVVTMFEMRPSPGIRVSRVLGLADDIALGLKALSVRIQAPIPGTDTVGIEVPNEHRQMVNFRELAESEDFVNGNGPLTMILGKDIAGRPYMADLSTMPHLLVAGATGAGKSVCLNGILVSLLYRTQPRDMRLLLVDPKRIEMSGYADEPHLIHPVVTEPEDAQSALDWAVSEMDRRFKDMARLGARNITSYNRKLAERKETLPPEYADLEHMPYLVIVIDELADLMMTAGREVEQAIVRLAQLARAAGIHMILATQRPSVDVVTGLIKANFPCRISFQVTSMSNSRTILDQGGAERLLGKGDMLFKPSGKPLVRLHGPYLSDDEVHSVVKHWKYHLKPSYEVDFASLAQDAAGSGGSGGKGGATDALYKEVVAFVMEHGSASTSLVQRHFRIGYNRAATIMDQLQEDGLVGPANGSKPRAVIK